MLPTICFAVLLVAFYAALGRGATPRAERVPWTSWTAKDLLGNAVLGFLRLNQLQQRNPMTPQRRTPLHS